MLGKTRAGFSETELDLGLESSIRVATAAQHVSKALCPTQFCARLWEIKFWGDGGHLGC